MDTVGDIIGRGYRAGRAIGDDWSESRFNRGAVKIRAKYEEAAAAEGKALEDYLPNIESDLRELAQKTGVIKRNVTGRDGRALDVGASEALYADITRQAERRAGAQAMGGDLGGALGTRAATQYKVGNFDQGVQQQQAQDRVGVTAGAIDAQGNYSPARGAQGMANVQAKYGQGDQAAQQTEQAETFRLKEAAKYADQLYRMASNPKMFEPDQFSGTFEAFKQVVPELGDIRLQLDQKAAEPIIVYQGGKATGSLSVDEFASMAQQFTAAPGQSVQSYMKARTDAISAEKERSTKTSEKYQDARIDVAKKLVDEFDMPAGVAKQLTDFTSSSGGWQLQDIGSEPGNYLVNKGGKTYRVVTNTPADPKLGIPASAIKLYDLEGNPVAGDALDTSTLKKATSDLAMAQQAAGFKMKAESIKATLEVLNQLQAADSGQPATFSGGGKDAALPGISKGGARSERNANPGNIEDGPFARRQPGYMGGDGRFAKFDTPESGAAAQVALLQSYADRGIDTVEKIIGRWSPQSDPTNQKGSTRNYAAYVARRLGVEPGEQLDLTDPAVAQALAGAMAEFERGGARPTTRQAIKADLPPRLDYERGGEVATASPAAGNRVPSLTGMDNPNPMPMGDFNKALRSRF